MNAHGWSPRVSKCAGKCPERFPTGTRLWKCPRHRRLSSLDELFISHRLVKRDELDPPRGEQSLIDGHQIVAIFWHRLPAQFDGLSRSAEGFPCARRTKENKIGSCGTLILLGNGHGIFYLFCRLLNAATGRHTNFFRYVGIKLVSNELFSTVGQIVDGAAGDGFDSRSKPVHEHCPRDLYHVFSFDRFVRFVARTLGLDPIG